GYEHVIVDDLRHPRVLQCPAAMPETLVRILTLVCSDEAELRRRIIERNDGFKDADAAVRWNEQIVASVATMGEIRLDVAKSSRDSVLHAAMAQLSVPG